MVISVTNSYTSTETTFSRMSPAPLPHVQVLLFNLFAVIMTCNMKAQNVTILVEVF